MFLLFSLFPFDEEKKYQAFDKIDKKFLKTLTKTAMQILRDRHDAEDAAMNAFLLLEKNAAKLAYLSETEFLAVAVTYTRNVAKSYYKQRKRDQEMNIEYVDEIHGTEDDDGGDALLCEENIELLRSLLDRLPESLRDVIFFRYFMDMKYADIGKVMGISESSASVYCTRAKRLLRKWMEEEGYHGQTK